MHPGRCWTAQEEYSLEILERANYVHDDILRFETRELYDVVLCVGVLAHVPDTEALVGRIACLLKPGGRCVLQFTDAARFLSKLLHWLLAFRRRCFPRPRESWEYTDLTYPSWFRLQPESTFAC